MRPYENQSEALEETEYRPDAEIRNGRSTIRTARPSSAIQIPTLRDLIFPKSIPILIPQLDGVIA